MPPVAARSRDGINTGTLWRRTSHFWSLIDVDIQPSPKDQPLHQHKFLGQQPANNSESPKAPSSSFTPNSTTLYSTLLCEPNSTHPTLLNPTLLNKLQPIIRYSVPSLRQGRRPHRSVGSTPRISPPEGWRMNPGHRSTLKKRSPGKKKKKKSYLKIFHT